MEHKTLKLVEIMLREKMKKLLNMNNNYKINIGKKQKRRERKLNTIIYNLKKKNIISMNFSNIHKEIFNNIEINSKKKDGRRYSSEIKQFSLTLAYYSPKAYEYLRPIFYLPSNKMLQLYCSVINGEPGLTTEAFSSIAARAASNPLSRYLSITVDAMSIKKHVYYDEKSGKIKGLLK